MNQKILFEVPPIFDRIVKAFPEAASKGVIFSWGDFIYNPSGGSIPPQIIAHEAIHGERQLAVGVEKWWDLYLESPEFRFDEELPAHQEEYKVFCTLVKDRERRNSYLHRIACRLAGDLYGRCIPYIEARRRIKGGE
jgi:hypothetical protein